MLKKICNLVFHKILFRIEEYNKPDLSEGKYILCPNHTSDFDGPVFWSSYDHVRIMAKEECFKNPVVGHILHSIDVVPVNRKDNPASALHCAINYFKEDDNKIFLLFPQGTISDINKNKLSRIKPGAFYLADHTKAKLIPVFIEQPRLFRKSRIIYGNSISVDKESHNIESNSRYAYYRELWQQEILNLQNEAETVEPRKVRKLKLSNKHSNNNS